MKLGKQMEILKKKRNIRYAVAGVLCLVMAGILFAVNAGNEASAAQITLGGNTIQLDMENEAYVIRNANDLSALGSATAEQTGGKRFILAADMKIDEVTTLAKGTFAGEFDGQGHVITIEEVNLTENTEAGGESCGILFGIVSGSVKNLIVNIRGDVNYTRTSKVNGTATETGSTFQVCGTAAAAPYQGAAFSRLSDDNAAAKALAGQLDGKTAVTVGDTQYVGIGVSEGVIRKRTFSPAVAEKDQFGVICGFLEENASINRVYVKGTTLTVMQKAAKVSVTKILEGVRDKYFYYKKELQDIPVTDGNKPSDSLTAAVSVYQEGQKAESTDTENNVTMKLSVPQYVETGSNLVFILEVQNGRSTDITVTGGNIVGASLPGTWEYEDGNPVSWNEVIASGSTQKYKYVLQDAVTADTAAGFKITYSYTAGTTVSGSDVSGNNLEEVGELQANVSCSVIDTSDTLETEKGTDFKLTMQLNQANYMVAQNGTLLLNYELTIKNNQVDVANNTRLTITAADITLKVDGALKNVAWTSGGEEFRSKTILTGESVTLQGTVSLSAASVGQECSSVVTVAPSGKEIIYKDVPVYSFVENISGIENLQEYGAPDYRGHEEQDGPEDTYAGNHLYAGIFAGASAGSITECKQEMQITGQRDPLNTTPRERQLVGGIVGQTTDTAQASGLYLLGTASYSAESVALPANSVTADNLSSMPASEQWSAYVRYETDGSRKAAFDLAWLVKEETDADFEFVLNSPEKEIQVFLSAEKKVTSQALSYDIAYNARKSLTDITEENVYVSDDGVITLGDSGFYRLLNIHVTDGYYHYATPYTALENAVLKYPYGAPYEIQADSIRVVRTVNPLMDMLKIQVTEAGSSAYVYYADAQTGELPGINGYYSDVTDVAADGTVQLPYDVEDIQYQLVVLKDGHLYPAQTSGRVTQSRAPLPKMKLTCYNYYNANSQKNQYADFSENGSYEAGTDMVLTPVNDAGNEERYSFRYLYTTQTPEPGNWDSNQRFTGSDTSFMSAAVEYVDTAVIPKALAGENAVYLYAEVSKKNYNSEIYYYGPFEVSETIELNARLTTNGSDISGNTVVNGDVVMLSGMPENSRVQYMMSDAPVSSSYVWESYTDSGIAMTQNVGCYIYARINLGNGKYSAPNVFVYTMAGLCADIRVTPNTGLSSGGEAAATVITPTTVVALASRTPDAEIFYRVTEESDPIRMERITAVMDPAVTDGYVSQDGYKYFKVGSRWYRTQDTETERFSQRILLSHEKKDVQLMYVSAIAIADNYEPSNVTEYIYKVEPKQQVSAPEAALETRYMPGNSSAGITVVSPGGTIAFYSITPEVELYYAEGTSTELPDIPVPATGICVQGEYGSNYVVRVQARRDGMQDSEVITFVYRIAYQETVGAPTATPGTTVDVPTVVIPGNKILLSSTTTGAAIYYTTDGSSPKLTQEENGHYTAANTATLLYDPNAGIMMPVEGKGYFAITAVAVKKGLASSEEVHFTYSYPEAVMEPYSNVDSGKVELNTSVLLKNLTSGAVIYYSMANGDKVPEEPTFSSSVFSEEHPFVITQKTTIRAMAAKDGVKSKVVTFVYDPMKQLETPRPSIESGSVVSRGTVLEFLADEGVTVYYTMDGSNPADSANTAVMTGTSLILNGEAGSQVTVKAYAAASDKSKSEIITLTYQFSQSTGGVTASVPDGSSVSNGTKVNLLSDITDARIYYTTDGSSPIAAGKEGTVVVIDATPGTTFVIKAVAYINDVPGNVVTFSYVIVDKPAAPTASPAGGSLTVATRVSLYSGANRIYYTTDGTEPTKSSNLYTEPILINSTATLKAIAVSQKDEVSDVAVFVYRAAERAQMPSADRQEAQVLEPGTMVKLYSATPGVKLYYTTDGTEPSMDRLDTLLEYEDEGIEIMRSVTIKAVAYREDMRLSNVATWNYFVETIPAVEMKKQEEAKLAEEGLQDTDTGALVRNNYRKEEAQKEHILKEEVCSTTVTLAEGDLTENLEWKALEGDVDSAVLSYTKSLFGEDYTILTAYYMWMKEGTSYVQPQGEIEVGIPIPEGYENAELTVVQVEGNNKVVALNTTRTAGMLYAKTDAIGKCAIVGPERQEEAERKVPYLLILEILAGGAFAGGTGFFVTEILKKISITKKTTRTGEEESKQV